MGDWLNKFYGFFHFSVALYDTAIDKIDGYGLSNTARREYLPRRLKGNAVLATEGTPNSSYKTEHFSYKGE